MSDAASRLQALQEQRERERERREREEKAVEEEDQRLLEEIAAVEEARKQAEAEEAERI